MTYAAVLAGAWMGLDNGPHLEKGCAAFRPETHSTSGIFCTLNPAAETWFRKRRSKEKLGGSIVRGRENRSGHIPDCRIASPETFDPCCNDILDDTRFY